MFKSKIAAGVAALVPLLALADPFTDAVTASTTAVTGYATALVALSATSVVFMIGMKYVKKIRGAA